MRTDLPRTVDRALTVGAVLGAAALLLAAAAALLGIRPLYVRSGSMAPSLSTGSLAFAREAGAADLAVGDVVVVATNSGARVTHRIVRIDRDPAGAALTLRGDANRTDDAETYRVGSAYRVLGDVPLLGYAVAGVMSPFGLVAGGAVVTGLLLLVFRGGAGGGPPGGRRRDTGTTGRRRHGARPAAVAGGALLLLAGPGQAPAWSAPWTDPVLTTGMTYAATTVPAPANFNCGALGVLMVKFTWSAVAGATDYTVHYGNGGALTAVISGTTATLTAAISGGIAWVVANRDFGSTTWSSTASNSRSYTVAVLSLCS